MSDPEQPRSTGGEDAVSDRDQPRNIDTLARTREVDAPAVS
jgi:hypothetical protein